MRCKCPKPIRNSFGICIVCGGVPVANVEPAREIVPPQVQRLIDEANAARESAFDEVELLKGKAVLLEGELQTHRTCIAENVAEMERAAEEIATLRAALAKAEAENESVRNDLIRENIRAEKAEAERDNFSELVDFWKSETEAARAERDEARKVKYGPLSSEWSRLLAERDEAQRLIVAYVEHWNRVMERGDVGLGDPWQALVDYGRALIAKGGRR